MLTYWVMIGLWCLSGPAFGQVWFDDILASALERSPALAKERLKTEESQLDQNLVGYRWLPRTNLTAAESRNEDKSARRFSLSASQMIYDFGRTSALSKQASLTAESSSFRYEKAKSEVTYQVAVLFSKLMLQRELLAILSEQQKFAQKKVYSQKENYRKGLRPEGDLLAAEVEQGRVEIALLKAKAEEEDIRAELGRLSGIDGDRLKELSSLKIQDNAGLKWAGVVQIWAGHANKNFTAAYLDKEYEASLSEEEKIRAESRPNLDLNVTFERAQSESNPFKNRVMGEVRFSWEIPYFGQHRDRIRKIQVKTEGVKKEQNEFLLKLGDDIKTSKEYFASQQAQWAALQQQKKRVDRQLVLIKARYESGKASTLELSNAQSEALNLELELAKTTFQLLNTVLEIARLFEVQDLKGVFS